MGTKNQLIKRAHQETEYTPENVLELKKCMNDPIHFIRNYVRVQHPKLGAIPLDLYDYQEGMINTFENSTLSIVLSARQTGKCCQGTTKLDILDSNANIIKRMVVWLLDRKLYAEIYRNG